MRRYRDFVTRVVCCYSTETESEAGDEVRDQELIELLPAEGPASARRNAARRNATSRGQPRGAGTSSHVGPVGRGAGSDASDEYCNTSSDEEEDESSSGAMMRPAAGYGQAAGAETSPVRALLALGFGFALHVLRTARAVGRRSASCAGCTSVHSGAAARWRWRCRTQLAKREVERLQAALLLRRLRFPLPRLAAIRKR